MPLPKSRQKIINLFSQIQDDSLRTIVSEVVALENEYRPPSNFPIRKVEAIIDNEAILVELNQNQEENK